MNESKFDDKPIQIGKYNIHWDEIDENSNPFQSKKSLDNSIIQPTMQSSCDVLNYSSLQKNCLSKVINKTKKPKTTVQISKHNIEEDNIKLISQENKNEITLKQEDIIIHNDLKDANIQDLNEGVELNHKDTNEFNKKYDYDSKSATIDHLDNNINVNNINRHIIEATLLDITLQPSPLKPNFIDDNLLNHKNKCDKNISKLLIDSTINEIPSKLMNSTCDDLSKLITSLNINDKYDNHLEEVFNDPKSYDFLQHLGNNQEVSDSSILSRDSIYFKFDPYNSKASTTLTSTTLTSIIINDECLTNKSTSSINFNANTTPPAIKNKHLCNIENEFHTPPESINTTLDSTKRFSYPFFNPNTITKSHAIKPKRDSEISKRTSLHEYEFDTSVNVSGSEKSSIVNISGSEGPLTVNISGSEKPSIVNNSGSEGPLPVNISGSQIPIKDNSVITEAMETEDTIKLMETPFTNILGTPSSSKTFPSDFIPTRAHDQMNYVSTQPDTDCDLVNKCRQFEAENEKNFQLLRTSLRLLSEYRMIVEQSEANKSQISSPQPPTLIPKEDYLAISKERDQLLEDVKGVEVAFSDLHRRYEKLKVNLENYKSNEEILLRSINDNERELQESTKVQIEFKHQTDAILKQANVSQVKYNKLEMKTTRLERELIQKNEENAQLHVMCDELIAKMEQN